MATAKQYLSESLQCPICRDILTKPKLLPCSHTFCEGCLTQLHTTQALGNRITCAVCRSVAALSNNDVSSFPTNQIAQSLAEDFKERSEKKATTDATDGASSEQHCTVCDPDEQGLAMFFCQHCSEFLCESCLEQHRKFKQNIFHEVVSAREIVTGEIGIQLACPEHPRELQQFVCITCLVRICCRCLEVSHQPDRHEVIGMAEYEESHKAAVDLLQEKVEQKTAVIQSHTSFVKEQITKVQNVIGQRKQEIENVYTAAAEQLRKKRSELLEECNTYERSLRQELEGIIESHNDFLENISSKVAAVTEESTVQSGNQSLSERAARIGELETMVKGDGLDSSLPESIACRAELLTFHHAESNDLNLGIVQIKEWELQETVNFDGGLTCSAATHDGQLAVATRNGEINLFSPEGQLLQTLAITGVRGLAFLQDGSCVVRQTNNKLILYSPQWEDIQVEFETKSKEECGVGGLSVDTHDRIYVDYRKSRKIQVFGAGGGQAEKEIPCDGYDLWHVAVMDSGTRLLTQSHSNAVRVIDDEGEKKHYVTKDVGTHVHPSVCHDGTILLACLNHSKGVLSIEWYTSELEYLQTLVADQKMEKPDGKWCYLQELTGGKIVLCTCDKLYFYSKLF